MQLNTSTLIADANLKHLEEQKQKLLRELEDMRTKYDLQSTEFDRTRNELESVSKAAARSEQTLKELKQQRDEAT
jgi:chromosome segregation ATPase